MWCANCMQETLNECQTERNGYGRGSEHQVQTINNEQYQYGHRQPNGRLSSSIREVENERGTFDSKNFKAGFTQNEYLGIPQGKNNEDTDSSRSNMGPRAQIMVEPLCDNDHKHMKKRQEVEDLRASPSRLDRLEKSLNNQKQANFNPMNQEE